MKAPMLWIRNSNGTLVRKERWHHDDRKARQEAREKDIRTYKELDKAEVLEYLAQAL